MIGQPLVVRDHPDEDVRKTVLRLRLCIIYRMYKKIIKIKMLILRQNV